MEAYDPYDSMRFHAWKRHEIIVWNHIVPCMESHGRLMNLDPGRTKRIRFKFILCLLVGISKVLTGPGHLGPLLTLCRCMIPGRRTVGAASNTGEPIFGRSFSVLA